MADSSLPIIGFVGQGYIGKNYADDYEARGYQVIRYALEEPYIKNKENIKRANIVFIAVPTPTVDGRADTSIIEESLSLLGEESIAVIKSTILPGSTEKLQKQFPKLFVLHSPEFLSRKTVIEDVTKPKRNIVGIPVDDAVYRGKAKEALASMPKALYEVICTSRESELIKYANNAFFYTKVNFMNTLYDLGVSHKVDWSVIREAMAHEPWIGDMHIDPVNRGGRGAGGPCLIKDFAAYVAHYKEQTGNEIGAEMLRAIEKHNIMLLCQSNKDAEILTDTYTDDVCEK